MAAAPTIVALLKAKAITLDDLADAVDAYFADPTTRAYPIAESYTLDLAAAVRAYAPAQATVYHPDRTDRFKRKMVGMALALAWPEKAP